MVEIGSYQALMLFDNIEAERKATRQRHSSPKLPSKSQSKKQLPVTVKKKCSKCENHQSNCESSRLPTHYGGCITYGERHLQEKALCESFERTRADTDYRSFNLTNNGHKKEDTNIGGYGGSDTNSMSSNRTSGISSASSTTMCSNGRKVMLSKPAENVTHSKEFVGKHAKQQAMEANSQHNLLPNDISSSSLVSHRKGFYTFVQPTTTIYHSRKSSDLATTSVTNDSALSSQSAALYYTLQPSGTMYYTLQPCNARSHSRVSCLLAGDRHLNICNTFWRAGLAFSSYQTGDKPVPFASLWPNSSTLESLIWEAYYNTSLKKSVLELCRLGICCGPFHIIKAMLILNIIGLNTRFESGSSLLHLSCIAKNYDAVTYICDHGADRNITDRQGRTPAEVCDSVRILKVMAPSSHGHSHQQKSQDATEGSSDKGAGLNTSGHVVAKSTPTLYEKQLMFEMATTPTDVDELLLKIQTYDFDVNEEFDENGDFLIHLATREGISQLPLLIPLVRMFNADIDLVNRTNHTSLMLAAEAGDHVILDVMMCVLGATPDLQQAETGYTALHLCCAHDHAECVRVLLNRGADYNIEDKHRMRPDDLAVKVKGEDCDSSVLIQKYRVERMGLLKDLIQQDQLTSLRSTDLFVTDPDTGYTLLMLAAQFNKPKSLRTLLNFDQAPINAQHGQTMQTALSFAAEEGNIEALTVLLEKQANPSILDLNRLIPLHHAVKNNHLDFVRKMLEQKDCLLGLELASRLSSSDEMKDVIKSAMVRRQRDIVTPALFECAMTGDAERLYCILEEGDCVSPVSGFGQWPLYLAVENGLLQVVRLLCECGADLHRRHNSTGNTILHLSSALGLFDITQHLLKIYSKTWTSSDRTDVDRIVHLMNFDGKTPLMLAAEKGWMNVVQLLLSYGSSTSVLNFRGELYTCREFEGCQSTLESHRATHTKAVMDLLKKRDSLKKLQQVFLPRFDHNLRDETGDTPLMVACARQNLTLLKFLLASSVYVVEHHKNFQGSFARSYASSRTASDSGRHSPVEENLSSSSKSPVCCHETSKVEAQIHHADDSNIDDGFMDKCCLKQRTCDKDSCQSNDKMLPSKCAVSLETGGSRCTSKLDRTCCHNNKLGIYLGEQSDEKLYKACGCTCQDKAKPSEGDACQNGQNRDELSSKNVQGLPLDTIITETGYIPEDKEYEEQIQENISALFTSIHSVNNRGSIFVTEIMVSHLCARNPTSGATCFHRAIAAGDNVQLLSLLMEKDRAGINLQDHAGLTPIHLAVQLGRKRIVAKMTSLSYVDLNVRTLDGRLPEEMTKDTSIQQLLKKSRDQEPEKSLLSPLLSSLSTSMFGAGSLNHSDNNNSLNFDRTHREYMDLRQTLNYENNIVDKSNALLIGIM